MSDRTLTRREEGGLLKAAQDTLIRGAYPNPERSGCPDKDTLRAIVSRKLSTEMLVEWSDHIGLCSPCYREYDAFRRQLLRQRQVRFAAIAATVAVAILSSIWIWLGGWRLHWTGGMTGAYQICRLDLRNRFAMRGDGEDAPKSPNAPLELSRARLSLAIYLPNGSREGEYEIRLLEEPGKPVASVSGIAKLENESTVIRAAVDLREIPSGRYLLGVRRPGLVWAYYPAFLK